MIAIAGSTGYVGGVLAKRLRRSGEDVRALARDAAKADDLAAAGCEVVEADVLEPATLGPALDGADVAYYLVHSMGRGSEDGGFAERDLEGAENFAAAAAAGGVRRIAYLGGLGSGSEHLDSRHATAEKLREGSVPVAYYRAAAVIGAGSESFRIVYYLTKRLPVMLTPRWVETKTQPIAISDAASFLAAAADLDAPLDRELQIGCPEVVTYGAMMDETARALGHRAPVRIGVPILSPTLSAHWIGLVTPADTGVAKPLIEGLTHETIVTDPSGMEALPAIDRTTLQQALREAVANVPVR